MSHLRIAIGYRTEHRDKSAVVVLGTGGDKTTLQALVNAAPADLVRFEFGVFQANGIAHREGPPPPLVVGEQPSVLRIGELISRGQSALDAVLFVVGEEATAAAIAENVPAEMLAEIASNAKAQFRTALEEAAGMKELRATFAGFESQLGAALHERDVIKAECDRLTGELAAAHELLNAAGKPIVAAPEIHTPEIAAGASETHDKLAPVAPSVNPPPPPTSPPPSGVSATGSPDEGDDDDGPRLAGPRSGKRGK